ncbi:LysM peptidoglycan-binding domain-containing protein [Paraherbaspirillum soli]|uniref:LysM peptidoglycan-binding domain-containing protein n=1 Tax=Paraherbaspirillum soli TaxID=631222 RepID=A0ABW0M7W2_9BURK
MTDAIQSQVTITLIDLLGSPIKSLKYQVKRHADIIAAGATNAKGEIQKITVSLGDELQIYVEKFENTEMTLIKTIKVTATNLAFKIKSSKVMLDMDLVKHEGDKGEYKRKTYIVKSGDTLDGICHKFGTTVRELATLNHIKDANSISIGQVIKLPLQQPKASGSASTGHAANKEGSVAGKEPQAPGKDGSAAGKQGHATEHKESAKPESSASGKDTKHEVSVIEFLKNLIMDRSADSGSPKADFQVCKDQSNCIKKGDKGPLIEEINIRLAGFGGALPTDEFTNLTESCVKQFQRDYMGSAETGRVCGNVLKALDEMIIRYPMAAHFSQMKCSCGACGGFGNGRIQGNAHEYPGIHRSLIWAFRAVEFYLKEKEAKLGYSIHNISSGYRCIDNNRIHARTSVNHMGRALDVQFVKHGETTRTGNAGIELIREKIFIKHLGAQMRWPHPNKISLESTADGATTWVHFDVREYQASYQADRFFVQSATNANGDSLVELAKKQGKVQLSICGGISKNNVKPEESTHDFNENDAREALRYIYDKYGKDTAEVVERMYRVETAHFKSKQYQKCGTPGMESHGAPPYYGWSGSYFNEAPIGLWAAFEGAGLSGAGGNAQITDKKKQFVMVSSVKVGMEYIAKYMAAYNGNYARWFSTDESKQELYKKTLNDVVPRIVNSFK